MGPNTGLRVLAQCYFFGFFSIFQKEPLLLFFLFSSFGKKRFKCPKGLPSSFLFVTTRLLFRNKTFLHKIFQISLKITGLRHPVEIENNPNGKQNKRRSGMLIVSIHSYETPLEKWTAKVTILKNENSF